VRCAAEKKCKGHNFVPRTDLAQCRETQMLKLQEAPALHDDRRATGGTGGGGSGISRMVDVELTEDLIDTCAAGDVVQVVGVLSTKPRDAKQKASGAAHQLVVRGMGSWAAKQAHRGLVLHRGGGSAWAGIPVFPEYDVQRFKDAARRPGWFDVAAESLCPGIVGHAATKAALLLALTGGTPRTHTRSNIHVAIFGDPGLGKSQLLRAACASSPRGVYVSANSSSSCGLTVSLSRDSSNETTFEAGAVVHGDGGVTCIDEIDKGASEHKALLEVMEQESLSIAKAGMIFSLPVKTTIIAAGNPMGGRFNSGRSITDNLNLSAALLSRFDFVFVLADESSAKAEEHVAGRVFEMHSRVGDRLHQRPDAVDRHIDGSVTPGVTVSRDDLVSFLQFARSRCRPLLTTEAKAVLKAAYLDMRRAFDGGAATLDLPVTTRQLQSLVRASEARAKVELCDVVTATHARFAVELMSRSRDSRDASGRSPVGLAAPAVTGAGRGKKLSLRDQVAQQLRTIMAATGRDVIARTEIVDACVALGCRNPEAMLQQMSDYGIVLQQSGGKYRLKAALIE
jgi:DNA helicase MCM8